MDHTFNTVTRREIKVPVHDLRIGMFVSDLDCDWLQTPFKLQGVHIRSRSDIDVLKEHCRFVYVLGLGKPIIGDPVDFDSGVLIGRRPEKYPIKSSVKSEFKEARTFVRSARSFVSEMLSDISRGNRIEVSRAREYVVQCVESVVRHPDAVAFMTRIRGEDSYTAEHCLNVGMLSIVFGRRLGLRKPQLINLGLCGLLHDAGKARIPKAILNKPGRLTDEEFDIMKRHTSLGVDVLSELDGVFYGAIEVAHSHHERPDGKGYPRSLDKDKLGLFTKIVSVVDAYDAITGDRVYAKGRPSTEALRIIFEGAGTQFDKDLALAFIQTIGIYPPGILVELVNGAVGVVLNTADSPKHLPVILLLLDQGKKSCKRREIRLIDTVEGDLDKGFLIRFTLADGCYDIRLKDLRDQGVFEQFEG